MIITVLQSPDVSFHEAATVAAGIKTMFPSAQVFVQGTMGTGGHIQQVGVNLHASVDSICAQAEEQLSLQQFPIAVEVGDVHQVGPGPIDLFPDFPQENDDE